MRALLTGLLLLITTIRASSQVITTADSIRRVLRIYEDNDFMNIRGKGTDESYTNGTRADYFYQKKRPSRFLDKWLLPRTGINAINTYHWSLMQVMITPKDIGEAKYIPDDYSYSGALYLSHGLDSYDPVRKFSLQSELVMGVMGPWSLAREAQTWIHSIAGFQQPMGWDNQLPNAPLLNYNFTYERMVWQPGNAMELIAGASGYAGTMLDGGAIHTTLRIGHMNPYFGIKRGSAQREKKFQAYFFMRPTVEYTWYNALLEGGLFSWNDSGFEVRKSFNKATLIPWNTRIDYGVTLAFRRFMIACSQKTQSASLKGTRQHEVGNISLYLLL
ncbi:lipid A deacylase LpxR family protein [Chitinophaga agrisoli]|uniref:Lipid A deacylase LpxR family protein n=1 Tax=Chitinophaga agrisoli TaxID=2607653 RepID=A0A5B2W3D2_9BACT|nr:lipid A deacylase LpxR family protein [Chitinophaga agrisoli]KAA2245162.1 lipid A deacylase LpxR family protein [Chitinophaga agrisoli]